MPRIIRTEMQMPDISIRIVSAGDRKPVRKALRTFHTLETMAVNIYKFQIARKHPELRERLIAAMANEMTHVQDFQIKLYECGFKPSIRRIAFWVVGWFFGTFSRLLGRSMVLKTGIWVETKAVAHYGKLLASVPWDAGTRKIIEKDLEDEKDHIRMWESLR